jgi:hypothetical protein
MSSAIDLYRWVDVGDYLARELQMNYVFCAEFEELHSPLRDAASQVGATRSVTPSELLASHPASS